MGTVSIAGQLVSSPGGDCGFPSGITNIQFAGFLQSRPALASAYQQKFLNSPAPTFTALDGVGTGESVTQGNFLFIRTKTPIRFRLTSVGPSGNDVSIVTVLGLFIVEFNNANYLTLLEAQGVGTIEYFVSGDQ